MVICALYGSAGENGSEKWAILSRRYPESGREGQPELTLSHCADGRALTHDLWALWDIIQDDRLRAVRDAWHREREWLLLHRHSLGFDPRAKGTTPRFSDDIRMSKQSLLEAVLVEW